MVLLIARFIEVGFWDQDEGLNGDQDLWRKGGREGGRDGERREGEREGRKERGNVSQRG